jgi:hypothetical protein
MSIETLIQFLNMFALFLCFMCFNIFCTLNLIFNVYFVLLKRYTWKMKILFCSSGDETQGFMHARQVRDTKPTMQAWFQLFSTLFLLYVLCVSLSLSLNLSLSLALDFSEDWSQGFTSVAQHSISELHLQSLSICPLLLVP